MNNLSVIQQNNKIICNDSIDSSIVNEKIIFDDDIHLGY